MLRPSAIVLVFAAAFVGLTGFGFAANKLPGPVAAKVLAVDDGDSVHVRARLWGAREEKAEIRLDGVNAPELDGTCWKEVERAEMAKRYVEDMLASGRAHLYAVRPGSRGRVNARIVSDGGVDIGTGLIAFGLGHEFDGRRVKSFCK